MVKPAIKTAVKFAKKKDDLLPRIWKFFDSSSTTLYVDPNNPEKNKEFLAQVKNDNEKFYIGLAYNFNTKNFNELIKKGFDLIKFYGIFNDKCNNYAAYNLYSDPIIGNSGKILELVNNYNIDPNFFINHKADIIIMMLENLESTKILLNSGLTIDEVHHLVYEMTFGDCYSNKFDYSKEFMNSNFISALIIPSANDSIHLISLIDLPPNYNYQDLLEIISKLKKLENQKIKLLLDNYALFNAYHPDITIEYLISICKSNCDLFENLLKHPENYSFSDNSSEFYDNISINLTAFLKTTYSNAIDFLGNYYNKQDSTISDAQPNNHTASSSSLTVEKLFRPLATETQSNEAPVLNLTVQESPQPPVATEMPVPVQLNNHTLQPSIKDKPKLLADSISSAQSITLSKCNLLEQKKNKLLKYVNKNFGENSSIKLCIDTILSKNTKEDPINKIAKIAKIIEKHHQRSGLFYFGKYIVKNLLTFKFLSNNKSYNLFSSEKRILSRLEDKCFEQKMTKYTELLNISSNVSNFPEKVKNKISESSIIQL